MNLIPEIKKPKESGLTNFCKLGVMSICVVPGKKWKDHVNCKFSEKASFADRCTSFTFEEYCTCLKAQMAAETNA